MSEPNSDWQRYNIDQAIRYSIEAVKSVLLMNGAAAIALLAFMGANAGKEDPLLEVSIELFKLALMCFGGGASLCALTFLFAYIAQLFFAGINSSETHVWPANLFRLLAIISLVAAIVMFGVGVYLAAEALSIPPPSSEGGSLTSARAARLVNGSLFLGGCVKPIRQQPVIQAGLAGTLSFPLGFFVDEPPRQARLQPKFVIRRPSR
jgi:hypothetical protein